MRKAYWCTDGLVSASSRSADENYPFLNELQIAVVILYNEFWDLCLQ